MAPFDPANTSTWTQDGVKAALGGASAPFVRAFFGWSDLEFTERCKRIMDKAEKNGVDIRPSASQVRKPFKDAKGKIKSGNSAGWRARRKTIMDLLNGTTADSNDFRHKWSDPKPDWWIPGMSELDGVDDIDKSFLSAEQMFLKLAISRYREGLKSAEADDDGEVQVTGFRSKRSASDASGMSGLSTTKSLRNKLPRLEINSSLSRGASVVTGADGYNYMHTLPKPKFKDLPLAILWFSFDPDVASANEVHVDSMETTAEDFEDKLDARLHELPNKKVLEEFAKNNVDASISQAYKAEHQVWRTLKIKIVKDGVNQMHLWYRYGPNQVWRTIRTAAEAKYALKTLYNSWRWTECEAVHLYVATSEEALNEVPLELLLLDSWPERLIKTREGVFNLAPLRARKRQEEHDYETAVQAQAEEEENARVADEAERREEEQRLQDKARDGATEQDEQRELETVRRIVQRVSIERAESEVAAAVSIETQPQAEEARMTRSQAARAGSTMPAIPESQSETQRDQLGDPFDPVLFDGIPPMAAPIVKASMPTKPFVSCGEVGVEFIEWLSGSGVPVSNDDMDLGDVLRSRLGTSHQELFQKSCELFSASPSRVSA